MSKEIFKQTIKPILLGLCSVLLPAEIARAQSCTAAPSCESLGFGQKVTDCAKRPVLKCPFDTSKVFCGVYADEEGKTLGELGDYLFSDKTFSSTLVSGKTPIAIIIEPRKRIAIGFNTGKASFGPSNTSPGIPLNAALNFTKLPESDYSGRDNCNKLLAFSKTSFPAVNYCHNYLTEGTKAGDWYLPAAGEWEYQKEYELASNFNTCNNDCNQHSLSCGTSCSYSDTSCLNNCHKTLSNCQAECKTNEKKYSSLFLNTNAEYITSSLTRDNYNNYKTYSIRLYRNTIRENWPDNIYDVKCFINY